MKFKAFIRVVKSLNEKDEINVFTSENIVKEPLIEANDKNEVKSMLLERYPQFFQNGKVYEKETKDTVQFFYVVIFPLYNWEIKLVEEGEWICSYCGHIHENRYVSKPEMNIKLFGEDMLFCRTDESHCLNSFRNEKFKDISFPDDQAYISKDSPIYIYRCKDKYTGKCYVGKTKNAPFFRWWNHLKHNGSQFGIYLRNSKLSNWIFEVLEELPANTPDTEVFRIESEYIKQFDSINNGFNTVISNKNVIFPQEIDSNQQTLF